MNAQQITALLHSIAVTRGDMPESLARNGSTIYRRLPVPHQAEWVGLQLSTALLTEPMGAIRNAIHAANREEVA